MKTVIAITLLMITYRAIGQDDPSTVTTGLAVEDMEYLKQNTVKGAFTISSGKGTPKRLSVPLDQYLPRVLDQGTQGACTAFAVAEALSIRENYINRRNRSSTNSPQTLYSPTYLWVLGKKERPSADGDCKNGISYSTAFSCIFNYKLVNWDVYPYPKDDRDLCHSTCPDSISKKKIDKQFSFDDVILDVNSFKNLLRQGYPICIATHIDMGYHHALYDNKGKWLKQMLPRTGEQHAMLVVDYDDDTRCFKVLDSHGPNRSDNGIIWLSYNLVNHNLDSGVVFGCYIVSFDKRPKQGPSLALHKTPSSALPLELKVVGPYNDSTIIGQVTDGDGNAVPFANIRVKGTAKGTSADNNGDFKINALPNDTLVIGSIGYTNEEVTLRYNDHTVYKNNRFTTWTKEGYFRTFNGIRIGVVNLNKRIGIVLLSITDDISGKALINDIELGIGENLELNLADKKLIIELEKIKHAGNIFNIRNWQAAHLKYTLESNKETLTQYF